jgi:oligosaccharide repeat unit polymerase
VTALAAAVFLILTLANVAIGRSLLYPPTVFSAAWTGYLLWLSFLGDRFFPLSPKTLGIFLVGGLAFSFGGLLVSLFGGRRHWRGATAGRPEQIIDRLLDFGFWICLFAFPIRIMRLQALAGSEAGSNLFSPSFWISVRRASLVESEENRLSGSTLSDNIILLASFLALAALAEDVGRKRLRPRTAGLVIVAIVYNVMTAGRASAIVLLIGLVAAAWMAAGRLPWKMVTLAVLFGGVVFCLGAIFVKNVGNVTASAAENVQGIWEHFEFYSLGGVVAFDHAIREPSDIPAVWTITRSFVQVGNKLGGRFEVPSLYPEYAQVSDHEWMNVYTMYFAYFPHFGWAGVVLFPVVLGIVLSWLYQSAQASDPRARLVYASAVAGLVLSGFNEQFFMNLTFLLKATVFSWVLYGLPLSRRAPGQEQRS